MLGCGNSSTLPVLHPVLTAALSKDMYDDGYTNIVST